MSTNRSSSPYRGVLSNSQSSLTRVCTTFSCSASRKRKARLEMNQLMKWIHKTKACLNPYKWLNYYNWYPNMNNSSVKNMLSPWTSAKRTKQCYQNTITYHHKVTRTFKIKSFKVSMWWILTTQVAIWWSKVKLRRLCLIARQTRIYNKSYSQCARSCLVLRLSRSSRNFKETQISRLLFKKNQTSTTRVKSWRLNSFGKLLSWGVI